MNRVFSFVVAFAVTASIWASTAAAQQWQEYKPAGAGYRVEMPGAPAARSREIKMAPGPASYHSASVALEQRSFLVSHVVFPAGAGPADPQKAFDGMRENQRSSALARGASELGIVRDERRFTLDGAPATRVVIENSDSVMRILAVLNGNTLYQVIYVGPPGSATTPDVERFMASFALVR